MANMRTSSGDANIVCRETLSVKARFVNAGIRLRDVAAAVDIAPNTLSDYLAGRLRNWDVQLGIYLYYRTETGERIRVDDFWGSLLSAKARYIQ